MHTTLSSHIHMYLSNMCIYVYLIYLYMYANFTLNIHICQFLNAFSVWPTSSAKRAAREASSATLHTHTICLHMYIYISHVYIYTYHISLIYVYIHISYTHILCLTSNAFAEHTTSSTKSAACETLSAMYITQIGRGVADYSVLSTTGLQPREVGSEPATPSPQMCIWIYLIYLHVYTNLTSNAFAVCPTSSAERAACEASSATLKMRTTLSSHIHMHLSLTHVYESISYICTYIYKSHVDATHCNTLQHTATHCNTLQHTATHCNTLQRWTPCQCVPQACALLSWSMCIHTCIDMYMDK